MDEPPGYSTSESEPEGIPEIPKKIPLTAATIAPVLPKPTSPKPVSPTAAPAGNEVETESDGERKRKKKEEKKEKKKLKKEEKV